MTACCVYLLAKDLDITGPGDSCEIRHGCHWIKLGHAALAASGNSELDGDTSALMSSHHVLQYEQDAKGLWELAVATAKPCTDVGLLIEASNLIQNPSMAAAQQYTVNGSLPAGHNIQPPKVSCMEPCIAGCQFSEASCALYFLVQQLSL